MLWSLKYPGNHKAVLDGPGSERAIQQLGKSTDTGSPPVVTKEKTRTCASKPQKLEDVMGLQFNCAARVESE